MYYLGLGTYFVNASLRACSRLNCTSLKSDGKENNMHVHGVDCYQRHALQQFHSNGRRNRGSPRELLHLGSDGRSHRGGGAEQRPELDRRTHLQLAPGQQRAPEPVGGRRPDGLLPEPGRHHPHRIGQLRLQRDLHATGDGRSDHRCHRRPGPVPIPERGGGPGPHRRGPGALYWNQTEVSTYVAGELANYATSSSVTSAISSVLTSYDDSSQVDSKIITALLDFYTRAEVDQAIADATSGAVDLSNYYTQAETQSYVANELLAFYPRTELDSQLTATFTQYGPRPRSTTPSPARGS